MQRRKSNRLPLGLESDVKYMEALLKEEMYFNSEKSYYQFYKNFWHCHDPAELKCSWVQECITEHLQAASFRQIRRLILNVPPRQGKSTSSSISLPPWAWTHNPEEKFWLISHSESLFKQNINGSRNIMSHAQYKDRWCLDSENNPHFRFSLRGDAKTRVDNDQGGYILGGSPGTKALGVGYTFAILDDVLDSEESYNPEIVRKVNNWYTQTFMNRSNDPNTDVVVIVMQRLAQNDIVGYVQSMYPEDEWVIVNLPAKYEPNRSFISPIGFNDPRKVKNELLDPVRLPEPFLAAQQKDIILYNTRYQQNPDATEGGNMVQTDWGKYADKLPNAYESMYTVWDLAEVDNPDSCFTVGSVFGKRNGLIYMIDMYRDKLEPDAQADAIKHMAEKYPKSIVAIESRAGGKAQKSFLKREIPGIYLIEPKKFGGSKEERLAAIMQYLRDGKFWIYDPFHEDSFLEDTYNIVEIKKELFGFPLAANDDIVDTISYGVQLLMELGEESQALITAGEPIKVAEQDYIDELNKKRYSDAFDGFYESIPSREYIMHEMLW